MSKLRWYFGPERKAAENCTPILLPENKNEHKQKFEVTEKQAVGQAAERLQQ